MVHLEPITEKNLDSLVRLNVNKNQEHFVSSVAESLAQAYVYIDTAFPFAIYNDEIVVGFIMMGYYEEKQYYTLWKLLIDENFQNMGYGRKAVELGIAFLEDRFQPKEIYTGVVPDNLIAKHLYESLGFAATGIFEDGMEEMCRNI